MPDTDAASTYDPYNYPPTNFGTPALAIDGEVTTAWTVRVDPTVAPRMAEGLLINLKAPVKLGAVKVRTTTPGATVEIYGSENAKAPASITDPGWIMLSGSHELKKKTTHLKLGTGGRSLRLLLVWLVKAPSTSTGSAQSPLRVSLNEVELFAPTKA